MSKHNNNTTGMKWRKLVFFSLVVVCSVLLALIVYQTIGSEKPKYQRGEIVVDFQDDVTYQEAVAIVEALGLRFPKDTRDHFQATAFALINSEEAFDAIAEKLEKNPMVLSVEPADKLTGAKDKMQISFHFDITRSQAEIIMRDVGLVMDSFYRWDSIIITVPVGRESYYVDLFSKQAPQVEHASLNFLVSICRTPIHCFVLKTVNNPTTANTSFR